MSFQNVSSHSSNSALSVPQSPQNASPNTKKRKRDPKDDIPSRTQEVSDQKLAEASVLRSEKKTKTSDVKPLSNTEILESNRRFVPTEPIPNKLKDAFDCAQKHLSDGFNLAWRSTDLPKKYIEMHSSLGSEYVGIASAQGVRPAMQDTHLATVLNVKISKEKTVDVPLFAIFDGHGGEHCAKYLKEHLPKYLKNQLRSALSADDKDWVIFNLLKLTFVRLGKDYREHHKKFNATVPLSGSTALMALLIDHYLWVACVGDTRAIISSPDATIALSEDAKPGRGEENLKYNRSAEKRGGIVLLFDNGIYRVQKNLDMALSTARAVGHSETETGINPRSKVVKYDLKNLSRKAGTGDCFLMIGCDGIFDVASSQQVSRTIQKFSKKSPKEIAQTLITKAFEAKSSDNLSALIFKLNPFIPSYTSDSKDAK